KALFGGLGYNVFNPALVGRAFLQAAFPTAITTWSPPFAPGRFTSFIPSTWTAPFMTANPIDAWVKAVAVDGFSGATPLALQKFDHVTTKTGALVLGMTSGSAGETSAVLILLCGAYLVARKMMDWRIPAAMLLAAFATSGAFYALDPQKYPTPVFTLFAGGLMLGAVFMASDMVASPVTPLGVWLYGGLMGALTVIIRLKGGLPEGVMYAILLGNAVSPIIDNLTQPRVYGAKRAKAKS
ncbi:MAG: RnfABCDGE type electron transport complex subunit D, partial [Candidatus Hydrogenedentes bacterium]|nr:RnfABCDGE type electron transport complex subunit D [Candidatus Hydrogenedentota bacterium]